MATPESKCPECGGTGVVILLTSRRPCQTCAARSLRSGAADVPAPGVELVKPRFDEKATPGGSTVVTEYDSLGRVVMRATVAGPGASVTTYHYEWHRTSDDFSADAPPPEDGAPRKPE